jgi:hypothetical protein
MPYMDTQTQEHRMSATPPNIDAVLEAYIECALWSSSNDEGYPLDDTHGLGEFHPTTVDVMRADVVAFLADTRIAPALAFWSAELGDAQIGHDLWLTRNGHGAGFWDRFSGDQAGARFGAQLTAMAKPYGSCDLYVGDDGKVYAS